MNVLLAALAIASTFPAAAQTQPAKPASASDAALERSIRDRFARSKISRNHFTVRVKEGVATLEGQTDVIQHKGTATRLAKSMGARQVVNHIQISQAARDKAAANLATGRQKVKVKPAEQ